MPRPRLRTRALLLAGLACALLFASPRSADAHTPAPVAVAMGDSYAAGIGGRWLGNPAPGGGPSSFGADRTCGALVSGICAGHRVYLPGADGAGVACGRSDVAPIRSAPFVGLASANISCSGAVGSDLVSSSAAGGAAGLPSQLARLRAIAATRPIALVVVSIGGNDLGFSRLIRGCALAWAEDRAAGCRGKARAQVDAGLPPMRRAVVGALEAIRRAVRHAAPDGGRAPVLVQGYPAPIPPGPRFRWGQSDPRRFLPGGCPFADADADWAARTFIGRVGAALQRAAGQSGASFLDLSGAFAGHEVCAVGTSRVGAGGPDPVRAEWVRRLVPCCGREVSESLHPNALGQRAIGDCLALAWRRLVSAGFEAAGSWRCVSTPGAGPASMQLEPAGS